MSMQSGNASSVKAPRLGHHSAVDGMRLFAFLAVFAHHALQFNYDSPLLDAMGSSAVHAFFVLSGFLIGGSLLRARKQQGVSLGQKIRTFYMRRILRIFPAYYLVVATIGILGALGYKAVGLKSFFFYDLFYLTNVGVYLAHHWAGTQSHLWTLSVQEQFYVLAPLVILTLSIRKLSILFVILWIACALGRVYAWHIHDRYLNILGPMQFDCLTIGVAAALIDSEGHFLGLKPRGASLLGVACGILVIPAVFLEGPTTFIGRAHDSLPATVANALLQWLVCVAIAGFVLALWHNRVPQVNAFLSLKPFSYLGRISYGLYLYHYFWLGACLHDIPVIRYHELPDTILALLLTVVTAALSWQYIETPFNNMKRSGKVDAGA